MLTPLLRRNSKGIVVRLLGGVCGRLGDSCGHAVLPRRDADESLEVVGELALVREAGACGDLRQGQVRPCLQQLLGPLDAAEDDVLVRRQSRGGFEQPHLPRRVRLPDLPGPDLQGRQPAPAVAEGVDALQVAQVGTWALGSRLDLCDGISWTALCGGVAGVERAKQAQPPG